MTELTAQEILLAQAQYDVEEAKLDLARHFFTGKAYEAIANLAEKVVLRWWVGRMGRRTGSKKSPQEQAERQAHRANVLGLCMKIIQERSGKISNEALQINVLGVSADVNAIWGLLIETGIVTPDMRQDYLDESVGSTYQRCCEMAAKIQIPAPTARRQ